MGYESRIYIVEKTGTYNLNGDREWGQIVARFDLGKVYGISTRIRNEYPDTNLFILREDDGNTDILEDQYGKPLKEVPIDDLIKFVEDDINKDLSEGRAVYRRYPPFLQMLKGFNQNQWRGKLVALHYGY